VELAARAIRRPTRGLRLRLSLFYTVFFTLILTSVMVGFREYLARSLDLQIRGALESDWALFKGYYRPEKGTWTWLVDEGDQDEVALRARLQHVLFIANAQGQPIKSSDIYETLGEDPKSQIRNVISSKQTLWEEKVDSHKEHYLIRAGVDEDENSPTYYYVAIGRSLEANRKLLSDFTWLCLAVVPVVALSGFLLGWIQVGRALLPVMDIAQAAGRISGSNLSMRIPVRRSHDELDYLIETFNNMIGRLEESFNQVRQFSTDVSHELRTPITVIRGQLEVALFTAKTAEDYHEAIVDTLHDIERLSGIVRALLLLSQAETGQVLLQRTRLDLCRLIHDTVDQFQIPAEGAQVRLFAFDSDRDCDADLDRVQIERMLSNLLSNAIKFTSPGGEVRVSLQNDADAVTIEVADTGRGISPEHLPHIFDRFYRIAGPSSQSSPEHGLGLGLSFVAWIAKAHGGTVDASSELGKGTKFIVQLPRYHHEAAQPEVTEPIAVSRA
jgi:heavy metal sensor kinase